MTGLLMNNKPHMHRSVWLTNQHREPPEQEAQRFCGAKQFPVVPEKVLEEQEVQVSVCGSKNHTPDLLESSNRRLTLHTRPVEPVPVQTGSSGNENKDVCI